MQEPRESELNMAMGHTLQGLELPIRESNWLLYTRLFGSATSACIVAAILLHELQCELSSQSTHWFSAVVIASAASVSLVALFSSKPLASWSSFFLLGGSVVAASQLLWPTELCDEHWASCVILLVLNVSASLFIARERLERPKSGKSTYYGSKFSNNEFRGD